MNDKKQLRLSLKEPAAVLETCAYLVETGATESKPELALNQAYSDSNLEIAKRMPRRGTRIEPIPASDNVMLRELFLISLHLIFNTSYIRRFDGGYMVLLTNLVDGC